MTRLVQWLIVGLSGQSMVRDGVSGNARLLFDACPPMNTLFPKSESDLSLPERKTRRRLSRSEIAPEARAAIFAAAARVVGKHGYSAASIRQITQEAGMAQGTFYLYFESRQQLFDQLLPYIGVEMLAFVGRKITGSKNIMEVEERGFRAFFDYLLLNPGFFRILNEAELFAPEAFQFHFRRTIDLYVESLSRAALSGEIRRFRGEELETLAYILTSARSYLYLRYVKNGGGAVTIPEHVVQTYLGFVRSGLL